MKILLFMMLFIVGCSSLMSTVELRGFQDRVYDFSTYPMITYKYCNKYMIFMSRTAKHCKEWKEDQIDITNKENFEKLKNAGFILAHERVIFME